MDVAKLISQFATPTVLGQVAGALGISDSAAGKALAAAVPGVLAALLGVASKPQGAANLAASAKWLDTGAEGMLGRLGQDPGAVSGLGQNLLSSVLGGGTVGTLAEKLQSYAGLPAGTADKLLGLAGAGTLGAIGQEARDRGLDAAGIARMLEEQQPAIAGAVPADFAAALKGTGLAGLIASAARPAAAKRHRHRHRSPSRRRRRRARHRSRPRPPAPGAGGAAGAEAVGLDAVDPHPDRAADPLVAAVADVRRRAGAGGRGARARARGDGTRDDRGAWGRSRSRRPRPRRPRTPRPRRRTRWWSAGSTSARR